VDYSEWDPAKDKLIAAKYSVKDLGGKQVCKQTCWGCRIVAGHLGGRVIESFRGLRTRRVRSDRGEAHELMREELVLVALGRASEVRGFFRALRRRIRGAWPEIAYDNVIAHKIEAGATCS